MVTRVNFLGVTFCFMMIPQFAYSASQNILITQHGVGAFEIGMSKKEIEALKKQVVFGEKYTKDCTQASVVNEDLTLLFENDILQAIQVSASKYVTPAGISVGSNENQVKVAYPQKLKIEPHQYDPQGHYLSVFTSNDVGYVFETDGDKVTDIHAGKFPAIRYVEGCL